ncbi:hypothetical protein Hanom_Chr09g00789971 [Helianthus anomalus]
MRSYEMATSHEARSYRCYFCSEDCEKCLTRLFLSVFQASNVVFEPSHNICCVYDETLP